MRLLFLPLLLLLLAACEAEPDNIQAKSDTVSRQLEERANQLLAEAENDVAAQVAPLDNEAEALLNQMAGNAAGDNTSDDNAASPANVQ